MIVKEQLQTICRKSGDIYNILKEVYQSVAQEDKHKEMFYVLGFDSRNQVLYIELVALGTVNACQPYIREVLRLALVKNACSIAIAHNHPSSNLEPSNQDDVFTSKIKEACALFEIRFLDHIICGLDTYYSYSDNGRGDN